MRYTTSDAPVPVLVARAVEDGVNPLLAELRSLGVPVVFDSAATDSISPGLKVGEAISKEMFQLSSSACAQLASCRIMVRTALGPVFGRDSSLRWGFSKPWPHGDIAKKMTASPSSRIGRF